jgi:hypothetical protein
MKGHKAFYEHPTLLCTHASALLVMFPDENVLAATITFQTALRIFTFVWCTLLQLLWYTCFLLSFKNRLWDDPSRIWIPPVPYKKSHFQKKSSVYSTSVAP